MAAVNENPLDGVTFSLSPEFAVDVEKRRRHWWSPFKRRTYVYYLDGQEFDPRRESCG